MNPLLKSLRDMAEMRTKSNEANSTGQSGFGSNFTFNGYVPKILAKIRQEDFLFSRVPAENVHKMTAGIVTVPVEGDDPTFYPASENANDPTEPGPYTSSKAGTASATLTARKAVCRVPITTEMLEDNITDEDFEQYVIAKIAKAFPRTIDTLLLVGDTTTGSTNVNNDGASASTTSMYIQQDGLVKAALDNATDYNGGTLDTGDIRAARALMGLRGVNPKDLVAVMDIYTYNKILNLGQVETVEKFGAKATIVDGVLRSIDGMEVLPTDVLTLAASNGKVSSTGGNNTLGRIVLVHKPSLVIGFRRELTIKPYQKDDNDQVGIIATFRYAQALPFAATSGAKAQALVRNITV